MAQLDGLPRVGDKVIRYGDLYAEEPTGEVVRVSPRGLVTVSEYPHTQAVGGTYGTGSMGRGGKHVMTLEDSRGDLASITQMMKEAWR